jgi:hypothetical protein
MPARHDNAMHFGDAGSRAVARGRLGREHHGTATDGCSRLGRWVRLLSWGLLLVSTLRLVAQEDAHAVAGLVNAGLQQLGARHPTTRALASEELRLLATRPEAVEPLRAGLARVILLLDDPLPVVRGNVAVIVALLGDETQVDLAYAALRADSVDSKYAIRVGVARAAGHIGPTPQVIALLEGLGLDDEDHEVRTVASAVLAQIEMPTREADGPNDPWGSSPEAHFGGSAHTEAATSDDHDAPQSELRLTGLEAAGHISSEVRRFPARDAVETVARMTSHRRHVVVDGVDHPIDEYLAPGVAALMDLIRSRPAPPKGHLRNAARVLGIAGDDAFDALVAALESDQAHTREAAAFGLLWGITTSGGWRADESRYVDAAAALVFSLTDESPAVRAHATVAVGRAGLSAYARDLESVLDDDDMRVRLAAAHALVRLASSLRERGMLRQAEAGESVDAALEARARQLILAAVRSSDEGPQTRGLEDIDTRGDAYLEHAAIDVLFSEAPGAAFLAGVYLQDLNVMTLYHTDEDEGRDGRRALRQARRDPRTWVQNAAGVVVPPTPRWASSTRALRGEVVRGAGWSYTSPVLVELPLAGAVVSYDGPTVGVVTADELGRFQVADVPPGRYNLRATAEGHLDGLFVVIVRGVDEASSRERPARPTRIRLHRHF